MAWNKAIDYTDPPRPDFYEILKARDAAYWDEQLKKRFPDGVKPAETPFMKMLAGK